MIRRILIIRFGSLGDIILSSAAVMNLRLSFPQHEIVYLTKPAYHDVVSLMPGVDEVVCLPSGNSMLQEMKFFLSLDDRNFDLVVDLHGQPRSLLARKLIGAGQTVAYPKRRLERFLATRRNKRLPKTWPHTIDLYNAAVLEAGGRELAGRPILDVDSERLPSEYRSLTADHLTVVIAPGAAHATKQWPVDRFVRVAEVLHEKLDASIVWATTSYDPSAKADLVGIPSGRLIRLIDAPLPELAAAMRQAAVTVANDSGAAHLSSAVGAPVVAIFGPTHPVLGFAPRGLFDQVIQADEFCRPCSLHGKKPCWRESRFCLERMEAAEVAEVASVSARRSLGAKPALFVDRDGTIIVDKHYQSDPDGIELIDGAIEGLREAAQAGYQIVILSNQSGVARGMFDIDTVERMNQRLTDLLKQAGVAIDGLYYCPHYPAGTVDRWRQRCDCRKPAPGMAEQAARELNLDLRRSIVVGDKLDDIMLAQLIGARSVLVRTGHGREHEQILDRSRITCRVAIAADLRQAVRKALG